MRNMIVAGKVGELPHRTAEWAQRLDEYGAGDHLALDYDYEFSEQVHSINDAIDAVRRLTLADMVAQEIEKAVGAYTAINTP